MNIFSVIEIDGKKYFLTDEQAKYVLKESVYIGNTSKFVVYYNPYLGIDDEPLDRFSQDKTDPTKYILDPDGPYLLKDGEYINPLEGKIRYTKDAMYIKDETGDYVFNSSSGAFVNPYYGVTRYRREGEFTFEIDPEGDYLYDPLLEYNNGFYLPYMDKRDHTKRLTRYTLVPVPGGDPAYVESESGLYVYDDETKTYYNPYYDKEDQDNLLTRYTIGSNLIYEEDEFGSFVINPVTGAYYDPYLDVQRYTPSEELSTFYPADNGEYIEKPPFDIHERPNFGFYNEFPEYDLDKEEFDLGQAKIFERAEHEEDQVDYIYEANIDDAELELGSIDRLNGEPLVDDRKARSLNYIELSSGQKYSITNKNSYWMQIFEYKFDIVLQDYIFIKSYKVTYGNLFKLHNLTTHVKVASGDPETTDLSMVKIKLVTDPAATNYVFTGPVFETFNEAYQTGHYYFFDCSDKSQFCKLVGDGTDCQAYERYQVSTKILKQVTEINDSVNRAMSRITQTGAEILLEVESTEKNMKSYIQQQMDMIRLEVADADNGLSTKIQMTTDAITALATSEYVILSRGFITPEELEFSNNNPGNFAFSNEVPTLTDGVFVLNTDKTINTNYLKAYEDGYVYFNPGHTYVPDDKGEFVLNGTYYKPYEEEINSGRHRYRMVPPTEEGGEITYEVDDENGTYILVGKNYIDPYTMYPRYTQYATFCRLVYNDRDGYCYDVYTSSNFKLQSLIEQTASQIRLEVSDTSGALVSRIIQTSESIKMEVENLRTETGAKFEQTSDSISAVVSSGGSYEVETDETALEGVTDFYSTRPKVENGQFVFNSEYHKSFPDHIDAYASEYFYFAHDPIFMESEYGDYIYNEERGYYNPYAGLTRYIMNENSGGANVETNYVSNANGRYIRVGEDEYIDPYVGQTRYMSQPAYCEIVKNGEEYTARVLISMKQKNEVEMKLTDDQIKLGVTDVSGVSSSLKQTANTIRTEVKEANDAMSSTIEQHSNSIEIGVASRVFTIEKFVGEDIPMTLQTSNIWYLYPPTYNKDTNSLTYNNAYSKQFNIENAFENNFTYMDAGRVYIKEDNGRYVFNGTTYVIPYEGVDRFARSYDAANEEYIYTSDEMGRYILSEDGETYIDPYASRERFESYDAYRKLTKNDTGDFVLTTYAYTDQKTAAQFVQTAEMNKLTVSDERSGRMSEISQTAHEIRMTVADEAAKTNTKFQQTADKIEMVASSGGDYILGSYNRNTIDSNDLYYMLPKYDVDSKKYTFDEDYHYNEIPFDAKNAFDAGYKYFPNNFIEYMPDPNGDYIYDEAREAYENPYQDYPRYNREFYDYDNEGAPEDQYSYIEADDGRYIYKDGEFIDPYAGVTRYIQVPENGSYNVITSVDRTAIDHRYTIPSGMIQPGDIYLVIGESIYKITATYTLYEGFTIVYDIRTNEIAYYAGETAYETFAPGSYEVVDTLPENASVCTGFSTTYTDIYHWNVVCAIAELTTSKIEQTSKEIKTTVSDVEGYSSQIKQSAMGISAIVKGAPTEVDHKTGNDYVLDVLSKVDRFYPVIPSYNKSGDKFEFTTETYHAHAGQMTIDKLTEIFKKNFRYFEQPAYFKQDNDGLYIKELVIRDPVYIYFNPKDDPDTYGPAYVKFGDGEGAVYMIPDEDSDEAIYFYDGNDYYSPWLETDMRFVQDPDGTYVDYFDDTAKYSQNSSGMYIREEYIRPDVYDIYRPYYLRDDVTPNVRYRREHIENLVNGTLLFDGHEFYDPYKGKTRYSITYVSDAEGTYVQDEDGKYIDPFWDTVDIRHVTDNINFKSPSTRYNRTSYPADEDGKIPTPEYHEDTAEFDSSRIGTSKTGDERYYSIDMGGKGYYDPYFNINDQSEALPRFRMDVTVDPDGDYILVDGETDVYYNPLDHAATYSLEHIADPDGELIYNSSTGEFYDPYAAVSLDNRFSKFTVYGKFFMEGTEAYIKYYGTINEAVETSIEQTAEHIRISASNKEAETNTSITVKDSEINSEVKNLKEQTETNLKLSENQIRQSIEDTKNQTAASITVNADSIEAVVTGSFVFQETVTVPGSDSYKLYKMIPHWDGSSFINRGPSKEFGPDEWSSVKADGFIYHSMARSIECGYTVGTHAYFRVPEYIWQDTSSELYNYASSEYYDGVNDKYSTIRLDRLAREVNVDQDPNDPDTKYTYYLSDTGKFIGIWNIANGKYDAYCEGDWYRYVNGYAKYRNIGTDTCEYDFFMRADARLESTITQTADEIKMQVSDNENGNKASFKINSDSIESLVSGAIIVIDSVTENNVLNSEYLYSVMPKYDKNSEEFIFSTDGSKHWAICNGTVNETDHSIDRLIEKGYIYFERDRYYLEVGPANATCCQDPDTGEYIYKSTYGTPYRKSYKMEENGDDTRILVDNYIEDESGSYIYHNGSYIYISKWYKDVSAYGKITDFDTSSNNLAYDVIIMSSEDYGSKISQTQQSIIMSVEGADDIRASFGMYIGDDGLSHIHITGNRLYLKSDYTELREDGYFTTTEAHIGSWQISSNFYWEEYDRDGSTLTEYQTLRLTNAIYSTDSTNARVDEDNFFIDVTQSYLVFLNADRTEEEYSQNDKVIGSVYRHDLKDRDGTIYFTTLQHNFYITRNGYLFAQTGDIASFTFDQNGFFIRETVYEPYEQTNNIFSLYSTPTAGGWKSLIDETIVSNLRIEIKTLIGSSYDWTFRLLDDGSLYAKYIKASRGYIGNLHLYEGRLEGWTHRYRYFKPTDRYGQAYKLTWSNGATYTPAEPNASGAWYFYNSETHQYFNGFENGIYSTDSWYGDNGYPMDIDYETGVTYYEAAAGLYTREIVAEELTGLYSNDDIYGKSLYRTGMNSLLRFYAGVYIKDGLVDIDSGKFIVLSDGSVYAKYISVDGGFIGGTDGWAVKSQYIQSIDQEVGLYSGTYNTKTSIRTGDSSPIRFYAGSTTLSSAPFMVLADGTLYTSAGKVGPWYLTDISLYSTRMIGYSYKEFNGLSYANAIHGTDGNNLILFTGLRFAKQNSNGTISYLENYSNKHIMNSDYLNTYLSSYSMICSLQITDAGNIFANEVHSPLGDFYELAVNHITAIAGINTSEITCTKIIAGQNSGTYFSMYYDGGDSTNRRNYSVTSLTVDGLVITITLNDNLIQAKTIQITHKNIFGLEEKTVSVTIPAGSKTATVNTNSIWRISSDSLTATPSSFSQALTQNADTASIDFHASITPWDTNTYSLGSPGYKWKNIYLSGDLFNAEGVSQITGSDSRFKHDITYLTDEYDEIFADLKIVSFRYNDRKRLHFGMMADDVKNTLDKFGINTNDFAAYCNVYYPDSDDNMIEYKALRYVEFLPLTMIQVQKHADRIKAIEDKIKELQRQLNEILGIT